MPHPRPENPTQARTFMVQVNVDDLNSVMVCLETDQEFADFAKGLQRGVNAGRLREDASEAMESGFNVGLSARARAEGFRSKQSEGGKTSAANRVRKYGTAQPPRSDFEDSSDSPRSDFESPFEDTFEVLSNNPVPSNQESINEKPVPTRPGQEGISSSVGTLTPRTSTGQKKTKPKLEEILGPKGSPDDAAYWKLVAIFGGAKNPAPTQTAQAFVDAIMKVSSHSILAKAQNLRDSLSGPQYMPQLQKWLDGQGYLNPDTLTGKGPSHLSGTDAEFLAAYAEGGISA